MTNSSPDILAAKERTRLVALIGTLILLPGAVALLARPAREQFELVTTIPVETVLTQQGTRPTAAVWKEMFSRARKTIDLAQFYLAGAGSEPLAGVLQTLEEAALRGVRIRFLIGKPVNEGMEKALEEALESVRRWKNTRIVFFDWRELTGGILHAKYFVIDGKVSFVGSQNFDWRALKHIHETGVKIVSPRFARALTAIFEADLAFSQGDGNAYTRLRQRKALPFSDSAWLAASPPAANPPGIRNAADALLSLIDRARDRITVQLMTFTAGRRDGGSPYTQIVDALFRAARRGVRVRLFLSDWNNREAGVELMRRLAAAANIEVFLVTLPQASGPFIPYARVMHSKVMRIDDDLCWIGTSNWEYDYFHASRNVEVVFRHRTIAARLDRQLRQIEESGYCERVGEQTCFVQPKTH